MVSLQNMSLLLQAMNLLDPPVDANAKSRCKALVRRGTAQFQIEDFIEGESTGF